MAIVEINRVINTILTFYEEERPIFNAIIDNFFQGERITLFKGIRNVIPESSLPSIEVGPVSGTPSWFAVRSQQEESALEIHISVSCSDIVSAINLEGKLVNFAQRILLHPPHLRPLIQGTNTVLFDSFPGPVQYGSAASDGRIRVSKMSWTGKALECLSDSLFPPFLQGGGVWPGNLA